VAGLALVWPFESEKRRPRARDLWWEDPYRTYKVRGY
jgi:hypothetical protein